MKLFHICFKTIITPICKHRSIKQPLGWHWKWSWERSIGKIRELFCLVRGWMTGKCSAVFGENTLTFSYRNLRSNLKSQIWDSKHAGFSRVCEVKVCLLLPEREAGRTACHGQSRSAQRRMQKLKHTSCFLSFAINKSLLITALRWTNKSFQLGVIYVLQPLPFHSRKFHRNPEEICLPLPVSIY